MDGKGEEREKRGIWRDERGERWMWCEVNSGGLSVEGYQRRDVHVGGERGKKRI